MEFCQSKKVGTLIIDVTIRMATKGSYVNLDRLKYSKGTQ